MNTLSYRPTNDNGFSFELLVDGEPLGALVGAQDYAIPYWIIEDDLPHCPPCGDESDPELRIIAVCSCGEYGCGHTRCRAIAEGDCITFCDFDVDASHEGKLKIFRFDRANYDVVVSEVVQLAREFRTDSP